MRELLLCPPDYYGIEYEINPWMSRAHGADAALVQKQWKELHARLSNLDFEGEGDALFGGDALFCGYKFRSDIQSHRALADILGCLVISVELVDPRFYHLDTCFCPLPDGSAFWFPSAFDEYGQRAIREHVRELIEVSEEEAKHFSCNA